MRKKKILCYNFLNKKKCHYGNKCDYAHSLSEQNIDPIRKKIYNIIQSNGSLQDIDLLDDIKLYEGFLQLTKVCSLCSKGLCPGGYNCRNGAINQKYKICYEDLIAKNCKKNNCPNIHLTKRNLIPYITQKNKKRNFGGTDINYTSDENFNKDNAEINEENNFWIRNKKKYNKTKNSFDNSMTSYNISDKKNRDQDSFEMTEAGTQNSFNIYNLKNLISTEKFLRANFCKKKIDYDASTETEENINEMIEYLNDYEKDSEEESIFD